jgi:hypothetical protein
MLFVQTSAPTGWTKSSTHDNKSLRVVSGTASSGGSVAFTTAFASQAVSGSIGNTTITTSTMPSHSHSHTFGSRYGSSNTNVFDANGNVTGGPIFNATGPTSPSIGSTGSDGAHNHTFTGTAINLAVQYVDVIIATKD